MQLRNSVAILTGASRGIGVVLAEHLARKGVNLALAARSEADLEKTAERVRVYGVRAITVPTDVQNNADLQNLVDRTTAELGPIDLLINNAGIESYSRFHESDPKKIEDILRTNVIAVELLTRFALPGMVKRRKGHVVNISSAAGKTAVPYNTVYSSSKHALVGFSWSLREELKPLGIGVSVVCPGFVSDTGMAFSWMKGTKAPKVAGMVAPDKVAEVTIEAIEKDKAEVIVSGGLGKIVDVFHAISPALTTTIARRSGLYDYLEKQTKGDGSNEH